MPGGDNPAEINYVNNILNVIYQDFYINEIKRLLFSLEKCIIKICKMIKMNSKMNKVLGNWILNLSIKTPDLSEEKLYNNILIRNEILKLLLDTNLYNLSDYSSMSYFLRTFNENFIINQTGLLNMDFFKKVSDFSIVFLTNPILFNPSHFSLSVYHFTFSV